MFFKFDMDGESLKKFIIMVDVGFEPTTQKTHGLSTTPFVKVVVEGISVIRLRLGKLPVNLCKWSNGLIPH